MSFVHSIYNSNFQVQYFPTINLTIFLFSWRRKKRKRKIKMKRLLRKQWERYASYFILLWFSRQNVKLLRKLSVAINCKIFILQLEALMAKAKEDESKSKRCSVCSQSRVQCMFTISNVRSQYRQRRIQIANMCIECIFFSWLHQFRAHHNFVIETVSPGDKRLFPQGV